MIVKLENSLEKLKIGLIGKRSFVFEDSLNKRKLRYVKIENVSLIDESFDIIFGSGVYTLLKTDILTLPKYGFVFFHETPLPEGRGNAPLQWTIDNKRNNITVTAFRADQVMDSGDYICQYGIPISRLDTLMDLESKRLQGIKASFEVILEEMSQGCLVFRKQSGNVSYSPKRTPKDSELPVHLPLLELWEKIRVCHNEDYPAFFRLDGKKIILRYEVVPDFPASS